MAKVSRQMISLLERNEYTPSVIIALRIAHIFNEPVENVFSLDEEGEKDEKDKKIKRLTTAQRILM